MDGATATLILTDPKIVLPQQSDKDIREAAKVVFLDEYDKLMANDPELEEKIFKVKGLMSELFTHKKKKTKSQRRRRSSINQTSTDDQTRKKVRFNISSTIYEDVSAIQDESMSIIEPLSIYSNVSPPNELYDVSLPEVRRNSNLLHVSRNSL